MTSIFRELLVLIVVILIILMSGCGSSSEDLIMNTENMEQMYKKTMIEYLDGQIGLKKYDEQIKADPLGFVPVEAVEQTDAQKNNSYGLKYLYIRNELHLERLSEEEKSEFIALMQKESTETALLNEFIARTMGKVISPIEIKSDEDRKINYAYDNELKPDFATADSLVIRIATEHDYNTEGNYVDDEKEMMKYDRIEEYANDMEKEMKGKLKDIPIRVFADYVI